MHSMAELKSEVVNDAVPRFVMKLWSMVNDPETDSVIGWTTDGTEFYITNHTVFYQQLLPAFYKHNNMSSFVRQLNLYGFKKMKLLHSDSLRNDRDTVLFHHVSFVRDHPELLSEIQRKLRRVRYDLVPGQQQAHSTTQQQQQQSQIRPSFDLAESASSSGVVMQLISDVKNVCSKVGSVESQLSAVKRENESLWREVLLLRQRHTKQQQVLNKLIQFLVTIVHPAGRGQSNISVKRKQLPMLNEAGLGGSALAAAGGSDSGSALTALAQLRSASNGGGGGVSSGELLDQIMGAEQMSPDGPIIRDVTDVVSPGGPGVGDALSPGSAVGGALAGASDNISRADEFGNVTSDAVQLHQYRQQQTGSQRSIPSVSAIVTDGKYVSHVAGSFPETLSAGGASQVSTLPNATPNNTVALSRTDSDPSANLPTDPANPSLLRYDSLLDEIQADLDGLRDMFGNVCSPAPASSSAGPSSWQESLLSDFAAQTTSSDATAPSASSENNQLLPYSPSLADLFSTAGDLFPDLKDVRADPQPVPDMDVASESPAPSPLPVAGSVASVSSNPDPSSLNQTTTMIDLCSLPSDPSYRGQADWNQSPMLQTPQRIVDSDVLGDLSDHAMTDSSLATTLSATTVTNPPTVTSSASTLSVLPRPSFSAPLGPRTVSVARRPLVGAVRNRGRPGAVRPPLSARRRLPVVRVARAADGSTRVVSGVVSRSLQPK